jgi:hypothetical protein
MAPLGSVTVPVIVPEFPIPCANAGIAAAPALQSASTIKKQRFIFFLSCDLPRM